ncbi:MAG: CotH kinase family protein [Paludibacteraceae bacterium]|nr:CotH kinase family protein [Paludibacteraceae bacterium]
MLRRVVIAACVLLGCSLLSFGHDVQTFLPVVKLEFDVAKLSRDTFCAAQFMYIENEDTATITAAIRHRGSSSTKFAKQSYAIKLYDEFGAKKDTSFMGMREDNYWILDAQAVDKARMRNRVAMDLWLEYSAKPYYFDKEPELKNGYDGYFVEVFVNDDYRGIYCLTERVDRKQLKLKKNKDDEIRGVLYKSVSHAGPFFDESLSEDYDDKSETWTRFEFKYPEPEDSLITWKPLYDAMYLAVFEPVDTFCKYAAEVYDIPVFMDYELFTLLLSARDNRGKNLYLSFYNIQKPDCSKLVFTPWDIDHSFGRKYDASIEYPTYTRVWDNFLNNRLIDSCPDYAEQRLARYAYWRENAFDPEALTARFKAYFDLFHDTGADEREIERWNGVDGITLDFEYEQFYISDWISKRVAYVDELLGYEAPVPTLLQHTPETSVKPRKLLENGTLCIILPDGTKYTVTGMKK